MRQNQLLSVLFLFLLVPASITRAQTVTLTGTVSIEQDYRTVNFNSANGNVKVFLPGDLSGPGQGTVTITGTVRAEPSGKNEKEKASNLKALQKMVLKIGANTIPVLAGQNRIDFSIIDNGKGINEMKKRAGANGLHNMQQRMKDINGSIEWVSENGAGTRVNYSINV